MQDFAFKPFAMRTLRGIPLLSHFVLRALAKTRGRGTTDQSTRSSRDLHKNLLRIYKKKKKIFIKESVIIRAAKVIAATIADEFAAVSRQLR